MSGGTNGSRIGLFGGTFNPIHLGHLRAAEEVRTALGLERVLFIPSRIPPHKEPDAIDPIASVDRRVEWVEQAIAANDQFAIERIEIDREGPSYLVDTLAELRDRNPDAAAPVFIVGEDAFAEMGQWREPNRIFAMADIAVMTRPPGQSGNLTDWMPKVAKESYDVDREGCHARNNETGTRIDLISITALDISSSQVRKACREQRSIRYLVPESIREAIEGSGEYGPPPAGQGPGGNEQ